jgi:hypothetical protein
MIQRLTIALSLTVVGRLHSSTTDINRSSHVLTLYTISALLITVKTVVTYQMSMWNQNAQLESEISQLNTLCTITH